MRILNKKLNRLKLQKFKKNQQQFKKTEDRLINNIN